MSSTSIFTLTLTLFLVIDSVGIIPTYLSLMKRIPPKSQLRVALRELCIALAIMILFFYIGKGLLWFLDLTATTVHIAGGVVLFLIAIRLIFPKEGQPLPIWHQEELVVVPIATPLIAGPSLLSLIMIYAKESPSEGKVLEAIFLAWLASSIVILSAKHLYRILTEKGILACQRLMGLMVALVSIQMVLRGIEELIEAGKQ